MSPSTRRPHYWFLATAFLVVFACSSVESDWRDAQAIRTIPAYTTFLAKHEGSVYAATARKLIESLRFQEVERLDTVDAYEKYLTANAESKYAAAAKDRIVHLREQNVIFITAADRTLKGAIRKVAIQRLTEPGLIVSAVQADYAAGAFALHTEAIVRLCELLNHPGPKRDVIRKATFGMLEAAYSGKNNFEITPARDHEAAKLVARLHNKDLLEYFHKKTGLYCAQVAAIKLMLQSSFFQKVYGTTELTFNLNRSLSGLGYWEYGDGSTGDDYKDIVTVTVRDSRGKILYRKSFDEGSTSQVLPGGDHISFAAIDVNDVLDTLVRRIDDQYILSGIAMDASLDDDVRCAVTVRLTNQRTLADIVMIDKNAEVKRVALARLMALKRK